MGTYTCFICLYWRIAKDLKQTEILRSFYNGIIMDFKSVNSCLRTAATKYLFCEGIGQLSFSENQIFPFYFIQQLLFGCLNL